MNNKLIIGFGIIVLVIMGAMCFMMYQLNATLSNMAIELESIDSHQTFISAQVRMIKNKYVGAGFSATPFN